MKYIYSIVRAIDNFFYRNLGVVSPSRREKWSRDAIRIQAELDVQHQNPKWGHWVLESD